MAFFTHPNGALLALLLAVTTVYLAHKRLRAGTLALIATPYLAIGAGWALYIAQSPADFWPSFWVTQAVADPPSRRRWRRSGWRFRTDIWITTGWRSGRQQADG